jgi:predicted RND superfamily exporter protein
MASNGALDARGRLPRGLVELGLRWPSAVVVAWGVALVVASIGVARLQIDTSTDSFLDRRTPAWTIYQRSLETFGGDETLVVALEGSRPWDAEVLSRIGPLTERLAAVDGVRRVDSLASVPVITVERDGMLRLDPALPTIPPTDGELRTLPGIVGRDRVAPNSLVSADGRVVAINVLLESDLGGQFDRVVEAVRAASPEATWISGVPIFRTEINTRTGSEIAFFSVLTVLAVSAILYLAFRSLRAIVYPLCISGLGTWLMLGAMGWAGTPITLSSMILPSVMLALGCAYGMHVVVAVQGLSGTENLRRALSPVALPLALSGLTTTIGFLAIGATRIQGLRDVGLFGAIGVLVLSAATLTLAPAFLARWPLQAADSRTSAWIAGRVRLVVLGVVQTRRGLILLATGVLIVGTVAGLSGLTIETDATRWFLPGSPIRDDYDAIRSRLSGISPVNVMIETGGESRVTRPDVLNAIDGLTAHLAAHPDVGKALSVSDPLRQIHGGFSGDPAQPLPQSSVLSEQYLLLLSSMDRLGDLVTIDRRAASVMLRADDNGSEHLLGLGDEVDRWWGEHGPGDFTAKTTGIMYEFARAQDEIAWGQLRGLGVAVACVGVILLLALRAPGISALALVPNIVPIGAAYGLLGLAGIPLDAGTVLVGSVALGIAVDDTIHLLAAYQAERSRGSGPLGALDVAFRRVLPPLIYTTVAVGTGFGILGFSEFTFTRNLGLLTAGIMVLCLAADILLLPALLLTRGSEEACNEQA